MFGADPATRWGFRIEPSGDGTRLTQVAEDFRSDELKAAGDAFLSEIPDRGQRNLDTMQATLDAIRNACEGG